MPKRYYCALYDSEGNKRGKHHLENFPPSAIVSTISHGLLVASSGPKNIFTLVVVKIIGINNAGPIWEPLETYNVIVGEDDAVVLRKLPKDEAKEEVESKSESKNLPTLETAKEQTNSKKEQTNPNDF